jgi:hypothetical protein
LDGGGLVAVLDEQLEGRLADGVIDARVAGTSDPGSFVDRLARCRLPRHGRNVLRSVL